MRVSGMVHLVKRSLVQVFSSLIPYRRSMLNCADQCCCIDLSVVACHMSCLISSDKIAVLPSQDQLDYSSSALLAGEPLWFRYAGMRVASAFCLSSSLLLLYRICAKLSAANKSHYYLFRKAPSFALHLLTTVRSCCSSRNSVVRHIYSCLHLAYLY